MSDERNSQALIQTNQAERQARLVELIRQKTYIETTLQFLEEYEAAREAYAANPTDNARETVEQAWTLLEICERNQLEGYGGTDEWYSLLDLVAVTTGVIGFDDNNQSIRDENRIIPEVRQMLAGNRVFQRLANESLAQVFDGRTLDFRHVNQFASPPSGTELDADTPGKISTDRR